MADSSSSFTLTEQLHFLADTPNTKNVVVTVQHWTKNAGKKAGIYVVCFNGTEHNRRVCNDAAALAHLAQVMAKTRTEHASHLLSEEAAATEVVRRRGPQLTWCHRTKSCGQPVPYASAVCADGHPTESVGRIQFASVTRNPAPAAGGRRG